MYSVKCSCYTQSLINRNIPCTSPQDTVVPPPVTTSDGLRPPPLISFDLLAVQYSSNVTLHSRCTRHFNLDYLTLYTLVHSILLLQGTRFECGSSSKVALITQHPILLLQGTRFKCESSSKVLKTSSISPLSLSIRGMPLMCELRPSSRF